MLELLCFILAILAAPLKFRRRLEAENAVLRHQLMVLRRKLPRRIQLTNGDRWFLVQLYRSVPSVLQFLTVIRPETLVRWHRAGFRGYWRWKSGSRGVRPKIEYDLRALIKQMSMDNPLWGAPRIHGELLKLGFEVAQSSVAKYMVKRNGPPNQGWRTFLRNHAPDIAAMDLFVVPTISFGLLYALVIVRLDRRELVWTNVTASPTAEWIARQITEAFPWDEAPKFSRMVETKVRQEVLYREALAMGLDKNDEIVKRRMAQKMQFLAEDVAAAQEPTTEELRSWFANHTDMFAMPPRLNFRHVYFSPDQRGNAVRDDAAKALIEIADEPEDSKLVASLGDRFMFQDFYADRTPQAIAGDFGPEFAQTVEKLKPGSWQGPIQSGYGWHLVYVGTLVPGRVPAFEEVEQDVKIAWLGVQKAEAWQKAYDEMRAKYTVLLPVPTDDAVAEMSKTAGPPSANPSGSEEAF